MELGKPPFGIGPEGFNAVDMSSAVCKFILSMVDTIMLFVAQVNEAAVTSPVIRVDDAVGLYPTADNGQQRPSGAIGDDLGIDAAASLEDPKHRGLARGTPATYSFDVPGRERYRTNSRNLASEILVRFTYLLVIDMTSFLLHSLS